MTRIEPIEIPTQPPAEIAAGRPAPLWHRALAATLKTLLPLVILAVAGLVAWRMIETAPVAERVERPRLARLVEAVPAAPAVRGPVIEVWGDVAAPRTLTLRPEIGGRVTALSPALAAGAEVTAGEVLVAIDDRTPRHALAEAEARIAVIDARIAVERGQAARAALDLARRPGENRLTEEQRALVLREPQMQELLAERAAAEATRDRAALDLARTEIAAPFDALVVSSDLAAGTYLTPGAEIATLIPVDRFEVRLAVPVAALGWIDAREGARVEFTQPGVWPGGASREGHILRVAPALNPAARMAEVIAEVEDPLARAPENASKPPLLIGSFLRARVEGRPLPGAVALDRAALRDGDTVWVMTPDDRLEIRLVTVAFRGATEVLVTGGLAPGERVVTSPLASVSDGMALRLPDDAAAAGARP